MGSYRETGATCAMKEVDIIPDDPKSAECIKQLEQVVIWSPVMCIDYSIVGIISCSGKCVNSTQMIICKIIYDFCKLFQLPFKLHFLISRT